jgi:hypothetical protein
MRVASGADVSGRGLLDAEAVGAVGGQIEPGQGRNLAPLFRATVATVPKAIEARGVLASVRDKTGIDDQGLIMRGRDDFSEGSFVEGLPVHVGVVPPGKRPLMLRTIATHSAKVVCPGSMSMSPNRCVTNLDCGCLGCVSRLSTLWSSRMESLPFRLFWIT